MAVGTLRVELEEATEAANEMFVRIGPAYGVVGGTDEVVHRQVLGRITVTLDAELVAMVKADPRRFSEVLERKVREMAVALDGDLGEEA